MTVESSIPQNPWDSPEFISRKLRQYENKPVSNNPGKISDEEWERFIERIKMPRVKISDHQQINKFIRDWLNLSKN